VPDAPQAVQDISEELSKCNRCGFCQTRCPVYRVTGLESSVARGHVAHLQAVVDGQLPFDDEIRESLFSCLMCRACTAECPPGIEADRVVSAARASYLAERQPRLQRLIFRRLLASRRALGLAVRALGWLKRSRFAAFSKLLRLVPWLDRGLAEGPDMMSIPRTALQERIRRRPPRSGGGKPVGYFLGCAIDYAFPEVGEASLDLLEAVGYDVVVARNVCCGLPPYSYGDVESARALARRNLEELERIESEAIVTDCASCASFLKDYPKLFEEDESLRKRASAVASRVRELSEFLSGALLPGNLQPVDAVVTYHDPCHLSRYQVIVKEPRALLQTIPGVEYRELPEADWCCGGAGSYALSHYQLSMQILERKMENIRATGARIVVTPCPACVMQLRYGAKKFDVPVEVVHLAELLRRALPAPREVARVEG
jgi:glycolate oxidase iron-sulfur subunit